MQDVDTGAALNDGLTEALASIPSEPAPAVEERGDAGSDGGPARDEQGRFAAKAEAEAETAAKAAGLESTKGEDDSAKHRIPLPDYLSEREKRQAAERRAEEAERRWEAHQRQLQQQRQAPPRPDPSYEPEAYAEYVEQTVGTRVQSVQEEARKHFVNLAFDMAIDQHGQEAVDNAMEALSAAQDKQAADEIRSAVNPAKALLKWHSRHRARVEVGDDIDGFKKNHRSQLMADPEFRKEFMAAMEAEARGGSPARSSENVTSLPSLNRAPGGGGRQTLGDLGSSDQEMFQNLTRKRR